MTKLGYDQILSPYNRQILDRWRKAPPYRLTTEQFENLAEYSCSKPSGVYPGKVWKRHDGSHDMNHKRRGGLCLWWICTYEEAENPKDREKFVKNGYYRPVITIKAGRKVVDHLGHELYGFNNA